MKLFSIWRLLSLGFLALTVASWTTLAQSSPETPKEASPKEQAEALETTDIPAYPDTAAGLQDLIEEMMRLQESRDSKTLQIYAKSLELPDADAWFQTVFGDKLGPEIAKATAEARERTDRSASSKIASMRKENLTAAKVVKFTDSCNFDATAAEYPILLLRQKREPLYDVRFRDSAQEAPWGFFAYVDGGFRFVGAGRRPDLEENRIEPSQAQAQPLKVDANVQATRLIRKVQPDLSKMARVHGSQERVILRVIIGRDGSVRDVSLLEGVCGTSEAVISAVKQWRYSPTLVNGEQVEVETTIKFDAGN